MTRKRTRESLAHVLCEPCPTCGGRGAVKTALTVCYEILREILREASATTQVGEASNGREALDRVQADEWDVVVLDITMPGMNGLEVLKQLKALFPKLPVRQNPAPNLSAGPFGELLELHEFGLRGRIAQPR